MNRKSFIALAISLLLVLPVVAACSDTASKDSGESLATGGEGTAAPSVTTVDPARQSSLEDKDWGGRSFTILTRGSGYTSWETKDIFTEAESGDPLNDAVYTRNRLAEDKYGIIVAEQKMDKLGDEVNKLVMAGDSTYDAVVCSGLDGSKLTTSSALIDLYTLPNLDLDKPWWDQNANADFSIDGMLFTTVGDMSVSDKDGSWILLFNKRILTDNNLDEPYELVDSGKWTYDAYYNLAKGVTKDLDGDGVITLGTDLVAIGTEGFDTYAAFFYSGARMFKKVDGYPEFTLYNERNVLAFDKYMDIVRDESTYFIDAKSQENFPAGLTFIRGSTMLNLQKPEFREMNDDYGILPVPKYDEAQDTYYHIVSIGSSGSVICVPVTAPDPGFSGYALEALCYESTDTVMDTYYNVCFNGKYLRDEKSIEMLKLAVSTRVFDFSIIYTGWGSWFSYFYNLDGKSSLDLASTVASKESETIAEMQKTIDLYKELKK